MRLSGSLWNRHKVKDPDLDEILGDRERNLSMDRKQVVD